MNIMRLFIYFISALGLSACNVSGDVVDMTTRTIVKSRGTLTGLSPAASSAVTVQNGYILNSTLGDVFADIHQTTNGGYEIYSNIQGISATDPDVTVLQ